MWFRTWNIQFFQDWICTFYMYTYLLNALVFEWSVECRDGFVSWNLIFGYLEWVEKGLMPENFFIPVLTFEKSSSAFVNNALKNGYGNNRYLLAGFWSEKNRPLVTVQKMCLIDNFGLGNSRWSMSQF